MASVSRISMVVLRGAMVSRWIMAGCESGFLGPAGKGRSGAWRRAGGLPEVVVDFGGFGGQVAVDAPGSGADHAGDTRLCFYVVEVGGCSVAGEVDMDDIEECVLYGHVSSADV